MPALKYFPRRSITNSVLWKSGYLKLYNPSNGFLIHRLGQNLPYSHSTPAQFKQTYTMADDTSYSTFLAKANQDPKSGGNNDVQSTSQARSQYDPTTSSEAFPASLRNLPSITYTSDTDSEFEPVFFSYAFSELPTTEQLGQVLSKKGIEGEIEELSVEDFDPRGEYKEIVDRVRQSSGSGEKGRDEDKGVKVFRVQTSSTRVEYYILTVGDRKLVGVMTKAVES